MSKFFLLFFKFYSILYNFIDVIALNIMRCYSRTASDVTALNNVIYSRTVSDVTALNNVILQ